MAKKKAPGGQDQPPRLTDKQVKELAKLVLNTTANIYTLAQTRYGVGMTDAEFDRMEKVGGVFKCVECNLWQDAKEEKFSEGFCKDCNDDKETDLEDE